MNDVKTVIADAVIEEAKDESDNKLSGWLNKFFENEQLSCQIDQIYRSEMNSLVAGRDTYSEMYSLIDFASSKSDTAIFKQDIINSIDEWRKTRNKGTTMSPSLSKENIDTFLDSLYHNTKANNVSGEMFTGSEICTPFFSMRISALCCGTFNGTIAGEESRNCFRESIPNFV